MKQKFILEKNKLSSANFKIEKNRNNIQKEEFLDSFSTINIVDKKKFKLNSFDIPIFSRAVNKLSLNSLNFISFKNKNIRKNLKKFKKRFYKKKFIFKVNKGKSLFFRNKKFKNLSRFKRFKKYLFSLKPYRIALNTSFKHKIIIRVTGNNFFCTFIDLEEKKLKLSKSAKQFNLKTSKKRIAFNLPLVLFNFKELLFKKKLIPLTHKLQKILKKNKKKTDYLPDNLIIKIIAKKSIRHKIIHFFFPKRIYRKRRLFILVPKKCFNGCRAVKARRKKRLRFRIFK